MIYKTIIVDDEAKALERMEKLCKRSNQIEVVGAFTKPSEVLQFVKSNPVDLAFMDIEMPIMSGLEVAEMIQELRQNIDVIFVTAFDKYALDAFQVNAVGYLLKPIDYSDIEQQLNNLNRKRVFKNTPYNILNMKIQCMGGFYVYKDREAGEQIKWRTAKAEELIALLIHNRGQAITKDKIIDLLWPDMAYEKASKNLHAISYYIREAFQELGYEDLFIRSKGQYWLKIERLDIDVVMLESYLSCTPLKALPDDKMDAIRELAKGLYFEGKDYSWAVAADTWIQNKLDEIALIQAERLLDVSDYEAAIAVLLGVIKRNACHDLAYKRLIQIYLSEGNQNAARQWYKIYENNLRLELDAEPDQDIKVLFK